MPNWQPKWENVRWDHNAANQAVAALRRAADELERTTQDRQRVAHQAQAQWRGIHRNTFDAQLDRTLKQARALANEYRAAAAQILKASHEAREEQAKRIRDRERWRHEKEAEDRRRREEEARRRGRR